MIALVASAGDNLDEGNFTYLDETRISQAKAILKDARLRRLERNGATKGSGIRTPIISKRTPRRRLNSDDDSCFLVNYTQYTDMFGLHGQFYRLGARAVVVAKAPNTLHM